MNFKFVLVLILFLSFLSTAVAQRRAKVYKLSSGKRFTNNQVDSLKEIHSDNLTYRYQMKEDTLIVVISVPDENPENTPSKKKKTFGFSEKPSSENSELPEVVYKDQSENDITKKEFRELMESSGITGTYSMEEVDGKEVVVMRPSNNPKGEEILEEVKINKAKSKSWKGKSFPFENMIDINGNEYRLDDFKDKFVVVNYWFVGCAPCRKEIPELNRLVSHFSDREDILFIAPSLSDKDKIKSMIENFPFNYTLIPDSRKHAAETMNIYAYPTNMIVDKTGKIVFLEIGYHSDTVTKMREKIMNLLES